MKVMSVMDTLIVPSTEVRARIAENVDLEDAVNAKPCNCTACNSCRCTPCK